MVGIPVGCYSVHRRQHEPSYADAVPGSNVLYYGDNLGVLRQHIADEPVNLIYLDPPFNSNATYTALFGERDGSRAGLPGKARLERRVWLVSARLTGGRRCEERGRQSCPCSSGRESAAG
jgi:hypothetical protein